MTQSTAHSASGSSLPPPKERRRLREAKSLTEAQLAAEMGVTKATIRSWETGRTTPRGRKRAAYAKALASFAEEAPTAHPAGAGTARAAARSAAASVTAGTEAAGEPPHDQGTEAAGPAPGPSARQGDGGGDRAGAGAEPGAGGTDGDTAAGTAGRAPEADTGDGARVPEGEGKDPYAPGGGGDGDAAQGRTPRAPAAAPERGDRADPGDGDSDSDEDRAAREVSPVAASPEEAFDQLYARAADALVRQTHVLTARRGLAHAAVEQAFQLAWHRWPEVAVDRDPTGWVRAAAHDYALSPWQRLRPAHRHPDEPPADPGHRELLEALHTLPPVYRRTLLLYDGLGLDLPDTAAETEASTPAAGNRVLHARQAVAERLPHLADTVRLQEALRVLADGVPAPLPAPGPAVRTGCERRAERWTRVVVVATALIVATTGVALLTSPRQYEPPVPPSRQVEGVPAPHPGPQKLSAKEKKLRDRLRADPAAGPARLTPGLG
ncbi:helix-turn-helix domain-containing protein [Streptomyces sp. C10-9-1]|uniref:helix-turn-helix domain-containing protein n=1 Tax=Streptomyces sp. C10-9-1 TaxID=1859285 RepID=UPI002111BA6F|nr:helix-turn-helix domain-containing protein [Streptomyces sp. C10-9-1]MCQ6555283.1 helix-turn-helix domain-containing protein [Streptomyces sp. C10-9-1]